MFRNYLKIALRTLWKNKAFSVINISGLAVGLATCLLMILFVYDELSFDKYNENADRIYRVDGDILFGGTNFILAVSSDPMGPTLFKEYPQVEAQVRFRDYGGISIKKNNENITEHRVIYADPSIFDVFTLPLIAGDPKSALTAPHTIVITESMAEKYFGRTDVVGQELMVNDSTNYKITGVMKDMPAQSHFVYDFFVSLTESDESKQNNWLSNNFNTYILLKEGTDPKVFEKNLQEVIKKYVYPQAENLLNVKAEEIEKSGSHVKYFLMPLLSIHLHSNKVAELGANSDIRYVYIFSVVAFFILLIACVNFMNLSTARSANRAREVGVRKVIGSLRSHLVSQFLFESTLLSAFALVVALALVFFLIPYFNQLSGKEISASSVLQLRIIPSLILLVIAVGLIAGSYPAFFLSRFQPIAVLKGKLSAGFRGSWLRSSLVVFQFAISIILIVGTVVVYNQLDFIRSRNLGYNRNQILVVHNCYPLASQAKTFKNELLKLPGVQAATMSGFLPTGPYRSDSPLFEDAALDHNKAVSMQTWYVDEDYVPALGMEMIKGRNFNKDFPTDSDAIIINEAAAKLLSFDDPVDKTLYYLNNIQTKDVSAYRIIGVMKDFNFNSLRETVTPLALFYGEERGSIALRVSTENISGIVDQVKDKWRSMAPSQPFDYSFMDDDFNSAYRAEQRFGKIFISFAILAILIACLGLFGLSAFAAEQRTKEIGIRKVLGATVSNITGMLSKDFVKLVLFASLIGLPIAWYGMNRWLEDFAYRINISWWIFVLAASTALIIALITVSFQAIKAAVANPVKSLRSE